MEIRRYRDDDITHVVSGISAFTNKNNLYLGIPSYGKINKRSQHRLPFIRGKIH